MDPSDMTFMPGFANLQLALNAESIDYDDVASFQFGNNLRQYERMASFRPDINAYGNFLGYIAFRLGWHMAAKDFFNQVLANDINNLNALENLLLTYEHLGWTEHEQQMAKRIEQLQYILRNNTDEAKVIKARCLTEQGFIICEDTNKIHEQEFINARNMYTWAILNAGDLVPREERVYWYFGRLRATQILYTKQSYWRKPSQDIMIDLCREFISDSLNVFEQGEDDLKADTWVKVALFIHTLHKQKKHGLDHDEYLPPVILRVYRKRNAFAACFDEALRYKPNDFWIWAKKANALTSKFQEYKNLRAAFDLLDRSITEDASAYNRIAFSMRGQAYRTIYRLLQNSPGQIDLCQLRRERTGSDDNWHLLIESILDFQMSLKLHKEPTDYRILGDMWRYLSQEHCNKHNFDFADVGEILMLVAENKMHCLEIALENYSIAVEMPAGSTNSHAHWKRGECLRIMNRLNEATESYKEAIECQTVECGSMELTYRRLFEVHLLMIDNDGISDDQNFTIFRDAVTWLKMGLAIFRNKWLKEGLCIFRGEIIRFQNRAQLKTRLDHFFDSCRRIGEDDIALLRYQPF